MLEDTPLSGLTSNWQAGKAWQGLTLVNYSCKSFLTLGPTVTPNQKIASCFIMQTRQLAKYQSAK
jgi:hypothetical protein